MAFVVVVVVFRLVGSGWWEECCGLRLFLSFSAHLCPDGDSRKCEARYCVFPLFGLVSFVFLTTFHHHTSGHIHVHHWAKTFNSNNQGCPCNRDGSPSASVHWCSSSSTLIQYVAVVGP